MSYYEPQIITADQVDEEYEAILDHYEVDADGVFEKEAFTRHLNRLRDPALRAAYVKRLTLVHRFVTAELDTEAPSKRGIGRLSDGDPPPRLGAKYRKQVRDESVRRRIGLGAEKLMLVGYAAQDILYEGNDLADPSNDDVWLWWLRGMSSVFHATGEQMTKAREQEHSTDGIYGAVILTMANHEGGEELLDVFANTGILRSRPLSGWHNARVLSYLQLFLGAGRGLRSVSGDANDPNHGSAWPLEMLENYEEKRSSARVVAGGS